MNSASPDIAEPLYEYFADRLRSHTDKVSTGQFGAHMMLDFVNDGPVTIPMDSDVLKQPKK
jgi:D-tyrosyl-tRNA(Tyr) deacylase